MSRGENLKEYYKTHEVWNKNKREGLILECKVCRNKFYVCPSLNKRKYCSGKCYYLSMKGKIPKNIDLIKGKKNMLGKKNSLETKRKLSEALKGRIPKNLKSIQGWNKTPEVYLRCKNCNVDFVKTEAYLKNNRGFFCSKKCSGDFRKGQKIEHLIGHKHSDVTKKKIGLKSKEMWKVDGFTNKRFEIMHPNTFISDILRLYKDGLTIEEISTQTNVTHSAIRRILRNEGINTYFNQRQVLSALRKREWKSGKWKFPKEDSAIELKIQNFLKEIRIRFIAHYHISEIEDAYRCDILIPAQKFVKQKTIIETDGCYWHGCPVCYEDNLTEKQMKQRERDDLRTQDLILNGFKVIRLWEHEIKKLKIQEFLQMIVKQKSHLLTPPPIREDLSSKKRNSNERGIGI